MKAGQGARLGDTGLGAQVAGRLAGGGGAQHLVAGALEGLGHRPEHGRLARAGHAHDQLGAPCPEVQMPTTAARCSSDSRAPMDSLGARRWRSPRFGGGDGPVGAAQLAGQALGDGALPGQHRRQRVGRSRAPATPTRGTTSGSARPGRPGARAPRGAGRRGAGPGPRPGAGGRRPCAGPGRPRRSSTSETSARAPLTLSGSATSRSWRAASTEAARRSTGQPASASSARQRLTSSPSASCPLALRVVRAATLRAW